MTHYFESRQVALAAIVAILAHVATFAVVVF
jgi:hypothetical protein